MSAVRLYVDEDAGEHPVVHGLRARGIDVLTTVEANRLGATDSDQLAFATEEGRTVYTFNVGDFARLHREHVEQGIDHAGIIVIPDQRYSISEKIRRLAGFISGVTAEDPTAGRVHQWRYGRTNDQPHGIPVTSCPATPRPSRSGP